MQHVATCTCERLKLTYDGEVKSTAICHCTAVQPCSGKWAIPDVYAVAVGAFADPNMPSPSLSVFTVRKHRWFELPKSIVTRWNIQDE